MSQINSAFCENQNCRRTLSRALTKYCGRKIDDDGKNLTIKRAPHVVLNFTVISETMSYFCGGVQKIIASILLLAFLGQTFNQDWYYVGYIIQQKEYVKRCVNKDRPQLHCNGKCQLMKKLQEQEEKQRGLPPELKLTAKGDVISSKSFFLTQYNFTPEYSSNRFFTYTIGVPVDRPSSLFHPPDTLSWFIS